MPRFNSFLKVLNDNTFSIPNVQIIPEYVYPHNGKISDLSMFYIMVFALSYAW